MQKYCESVSHNYDNIASGEAEHVLGTPAGVLKTLAESNVKFFTGNRQRVRCGCKFTGEQPC